LCSHACLRLLGESALAVRLPAALFGVGGVAALFLFVEAALDRRLALVSGALLAVSYPHVFYSQNARGYTALVFFALLAARGLLRFRAPVVSTWARAEYVAACALSAYSVLFGAFVLAAHAAIAALAAAGPALRIGRPALAARGLGRAIAIAALLAAMLY